MGGTLSTLFVPWGILSISRICLSGPLTEELALLLGQTCVRLNELRIVVGEFGGSDPEYIFRVLFASPSLTRLQTLNFIYPGDGSWHKHASTYFATVREILTNLKSPQHLELRMRMYRSMCRQFKGLVNLKSIVWVVPLFIDDAKNNDKDYDDEH